MDMKSFPLETENQLPQVGTTYETGMFDMKLKQTAGNAYEKAKDVAAFASAYGGVILIGALEDQKSGRLLRYEPFTDRDAKSICDAYENAVRARCSPIPVVDNRIIQIGNGFVVAINIWPFPGQVVGVKIQSDKEDGKQIPAWTFPMRSGSHTIDLTPEQTAMFMSPDIRRISTLLNRIPTTGEVKINLAYEAVEFADRVRKVMQRRSPSDSIKSPTPSLKRVTIDLIEYSSLDNNMTIRIHRKHPPENSPSKSGNFSIPLDNITSIWRDDLEWNIAVIGSVIDSPSNGVTIYSPFPKME